MLHPDCDVLSLCVNHQHDSKCQNTQGGLFTFQDVPQGGTVIPLTFRNLSGGVLTGLGRVAWTLALHFCSGEINIIMLNMDKLQSVSN